MSGPVIQVSDVDYIILTDEAPEELHQGRGHSRHGGTPGPPPAPAATPRALVQVVQGPRRTKRIQAG